jgi:hypothetical protein
MGEYRLPIVVQSMRVRVRVRCTRGSRILSSIFDSLGRTSFGSLSTRNRSETQTVAIKPIRTQTDYRDALKQIESLMTAKANSPEGDRLDVLTTLVEAYERTHFPMDLPDAVEAIAKRP